MRMTPPGVVARRAAGAVAAPGDGRGQRHPRLVLRRRALRDHRRRDPARLRAARRRAPTCWTSAASPPVPAPPGRWSPRSSTASCRSSGRWPSDGVPVSVDTMRHEVARAALEAGAVLVNDVSGGLADPQILDVVAEHGAAYVVMHWRAHSAVMQQLASYDDVLVEVRDELALTARRRERRPGSPTDRLVVDPGLGFAKTADHNWELLRRLPELGTLGVPILVGSSRKSFLGSLLAGPDGITTAGARPGGRQRGAHHDRGDPGGVGRPGPRGPGQHRRRQGGHQVARRRLTCANRHRSASRRSVRCDARSGRRSGAAVPAGSVEPR